MLIDQVPLSDFLFHFKIAICSHYKPQPGSQSAIYDNPAYKMAIYIVIQVALPSSSYRILIRIEETKGIFCTIVSMSSRSHINDWKQRIYSLSINSSGPGGSGFRPFLFLISATILLNIDCGTACHVLK